HRERGGATGRRYELLPELPRRAECGGAACRFHRGLCPGASVDTAPQDDGRYWYGYSRVGAMREGTMQNGHTLRVGIVGVGNCASSLVQGVEFYRTAGEDEFVPGLMHVNLGGYHVRDIEFSAAFDVVESKVGLDLSEAIFAPPNNTIRFAEVPMLNVRVHRVLTTLFRERGVRLDRTYQLNFGGNMDFYNMLERERLESKKISKTGAVTSQLDYALPADAVHVGPSDYVPWLTDRKWAYIR